MDTQDTKVGAVMIGDRIQISVALIRQWAEEEPDQASPVVVLTGIQVNDDGSKILVLQWTDR